MENRAVEKELLMLIGMSVFGSVFLCVFERGVSKPPNPTISRTFHSAI